jgi:hypothetical protein
MLSTLKHISMSASVKYEIIRKMTQQKNFYISTSLIAPECTILTFINFPLLQFVDNCDSEHISSFMVPCVLEMD